MNYEKAIIDLVERVNNLEDKVNRLEDELNSLGKDVVTDFEVEQDETNKNDK